MVMVAALILALVSFGLIAFVVGRRTDGEAANLLDDDLTQRMVDYSGFIQKDC
ncbi:MAG: hypothetical protein RLZZ157_851 [Pseudomonadota bacterium]